MARYDRFGAPRYDAPYTAWYPGAFWGGAPVYGWGGWGVWGWPYYPGAVGYGAYDRGYPPRRPPEQSRTYGRGGDEAARRWARRYGYDLEYEIRPRRRR